MATNKKKELIIKTYELLKNSSLQDVKIRTIASAVNCTSTTIYKHFEDLDHLITIASVRFLEDYIMDLQGIMNATVNTLDLLVLMWKSFAKYAFQNVEVFDSLFWGKHKEHLSEAIFEYYENFPEDWRNFDGFFTTTFFSSELTERNGIVLRRAAATGYFAYDDVDMLNELQCYSFHGLLLDYKDKYRLPGKAEEGAQRFMNWLDFLNGKYRLK